MLDKIESKKFNEWAKNILAIRFNFKTDNSEESMAHNKAIFQKYDLLLESYQPLISVLPIIITTGLLRYTFSIKHCLSNWESFRDETYVQFRLKFKEEKVKQLLRGLL